MRLKLLGTAAGGGFPQWNCSCSNCRRLRAGQLKSTPRTQSQVAVSPDGERWILLNASPDLRTQIESNRELQPNGNGRHSPIESIIFTNADLDHVLGLLLLRELQQLRVYGAASVRKILFQDNSMFGMLDRKKDQVLWTNLVDGESRPILFQNGEGTGLILEPFSLSDRYPMYVRQRSDKDLNPREAVLGLKITDHRTKKSFLHLPGVARVDQNLKALMAQSDLVLFDGTFWSENELQAIDPAAKTAAEMGHMPQWGPNGSLAQLADVTRPKKVFMHINNTNPMLDEDSEEYRVATAAGWQVGRDGMEFEL